MIRHRLALTLTALLAAGAIATAQPADAVVGYVTRDGNRLLLYGQTYRPSGVNAFSATSTATTWTCGPVFSDSALDSLLSSLRPGSLLRSWFFQYLATDSAGHRYWGGFDRLIAKARAHRIRLVTVLGNHAAGTGGCDDGMPKTPDWYTSGYTRPATWQPQSYLDYARSFILRYRGEPTIAVIEWMNEPAANNADGTCTESRAAWSMRWFFDAMYRQVKSLDPYHLFGSGVSGTEQCGTAGTDYRYVHGSAGIDVASYHDYSAGRVAVPDSLRTRLAQAAVLGKPLIVGEAGIRAGDVSGCTSRAVRAAQFRAKRDAQRNAGVDGFLAWDAIPGTDRRCVYENLGPADPAMAALTG